MIGAWFGGSKPNFHTFLPPVAEQLNRLRTPRPMTTPDGEKNVSFRLLTVSADNPAKEAVLELKCNACGICEQAALSERDAAGRPTIPTFPLATPPAAIRTRASMLQDAETAVDEGLDHSHGIRGPTSLMLVEDIDPVLPIDYSHNICLRVNDKLLSLMFDVKHRDQPFSVRNRAAEFDLLLTNTSPPPSSHDLHDRIRSTPAIGRRWSTGRFSSTMAPWC